MNVTVQKYGGSSVENKEKLEMVCNKIINEKDNNNDLVVIVSAQGKTTNNLIATANDYANNTEISSKDLDFLLSTGEMQTAALLSIMLKAKGYNAVCLNGSQAGVITDSNFGNAKILDVIPDNIVSNLRNGNIVIITGFQGTDILGNITTLGRGGSDLSAVAIACALDSKKCEIFSDIDGIYSADPKIINDAKLIDNISYDEMLEAASAGAKVLHNRSVNMAKKYNLEITSKCTFSNSRGSTVSDSVNEDTQVHFITKKDDISKICIVGPMMLSNKDAISKIYKVADEENIQIYMISFSELSINVIVDLNKAELFMKKLHQSLIEKDAS